MDELPGNSHRAKREDQPEKKVERVVEGEVIRRKRPLKKRFAETFIGGDVDSVVKYVIGDVLIPAAKDAISDAISQGIERMLFGESRPASRRGGYRNSGSSYTSYNRYSKPSSESRYRDRDREDPRISSRRRSSREFEFEEVIIQTRAEADEVLTRLYDIADSYPEATVADLHKLIGVTPSFTDEKWGWTKYELEGSRPIRTRQGDYLLDLPKPSYLAD